MTKRIVSLMLALALILGLAPQAYAIVVEGEPTTMSVTLHKLLLSNDDYGKWNSDLVKKSETNPEGYAGNELKWENVKEKLGITSEMKEIPNVYFAWKNADGKYINKEGQPVRVNQAGDQAGEDRDITEKDAAFESLVLGGLTTERGFEFDTQYLPNGQYTIVELHEKSTYQGENGEELSASLAVPVEITLPLVNDDGVVKNAHVYPKNTQDKPKIDKNFAQPEGHQVIDNGEVAGDITGADYDNYAKKKATIDSEIGKEIPYEIKTEIPKDAKYKTIVWQDTMSKGLDYVKNSLTIDASYKVEDQDVALTLAPTDYTLTETTKGFELSLTDDGLTKVENAAQNSPVTFVLKYKGKITKDAVIDSPEKNDVKLIYSNEKKENLTPKDVTPNNKEIQVIKTWATGDQVPQGVEVTYTLYEVKDNGELVFVDQVLKTGTTSDDFHHTFTELDDTKTYRVIESVKGYVPEYELGAPGEVAITNTTTPSLTPEPPKVVTYGKKFVKTNDEDKATAERLAGAEFVVKNASGEYLTKKDDAQKAGDLANYNLAETAYNDALKQLGDLRNKQELTAEEEALKTKLEGTKETEGSIAYLKEARDEAYTTAYYDYAWVQKGTVQNPGDIPNVVKLVSDDEGRFEIKGLMAGTYSLEEITPPKGYAKLADNVSFEVREGSYDGTAEEMQYNKDNTEDHYGQQVKNKKVSIPQTGGIGTVIFTVAGLAIMATAALSLRKKKEERA